MDLLTLVLIGIGLAMDCLAVALAAGTTLHAGRLKTACVLALSFGGFQAGMALAGWVLGDQFIALIAGFDHWVAFILLAAIGLKMIREARQEDGAERIDVLHPVSLLVLSVATSIDALAVGLSLAFLQADIVVAAAVIGAVSSAFAFAGVLAGSRLYRVVGRKTEVAGGVILILIGLRILLGHLLG